MKKPSGSEEKWTTITRTERSLLTSFRQTQTPMGSTVFISWLVFESVGIASTLLRTATMR